LYILALIAGISAFVIVGLWIFDHPKSLLWAGVALMAALLYMYGY